MKFMDVQRIKQLEMLFGNEKQFFVDGYYRIRSLDDKQKEIAYLMPDACGASVVHPQITIEEVDGSFIPVKLIDMATSPTQLVYRKEEDVVFLEDKLEELVTRFEQINQ